MDVSPSTPVPFDGIFKGNVTTRKKQSYRKKDPRDSMSLQQERLYDRVRELEKSNKAARQERMQLARADRSARNASARNAAAIRRIEYNFESP